MLGHPRRRADVWMPEETVSARHDNEVFLPTLQKIEETSLILQKIAAQITERSDHPDFPNGREVEVVAVNGNGRAGEGC